MMAQSWRDRGAISNGAFMATIRSAGRVCLGLGHTPQEARLRACEAWGEATGYPIVGIARERLPVERTHSGDHQSDFGANHGI